MPLFNSSHKFFETPVLRLQELGPSTERSDEIEIPLSKGSRPLSTAVVTDFFIDVDKDYRVEIALTGDLLPEVVYIGLEGDDEDPLELTRYISNSDKSSSVTHWVTKIGADKLLRFAYGLISFVVYVYGSLEDVVLTSEAFPTIITECNMQFIREMMSTFLEEESPFLKYMTVQEDNLPSVLNIKEDVEHFEKSEIAEYLKVLDAGCIFYANRLNYFREQAQVKIRHKEQSIQGRKIHRFGAKELVWTSRHTEVLEPSAKETAISYQGACFYPRYIRSDVSSKNYDTYEHRLLFSLLDSMVAVCINIEKKLSSRFSGVMGVQKRIHEVVDGLDGKFCPSLYLLEYRAKRVSYTYENLESIRRKLQRLLHQYREILPGVKKVAFSKPRLSKVFQELPVYNEMYKLAYKWFELGDLTLERENLVFSTVRVSKLYEYYVLHGFLAALNSMGYVADWEDGSAYFLGRYKAYFNCYSPEVNVNTVYKFRRAQEKLVLYFQPVIYGADCGEFGIDLHRLSKTRTDSFYTPDYLVVRTLPSGQKQRLIFDAKYCSFGRLTQKENNSKWNEFKDVLYKYKLDIESIDGPVDAVWLISGTEKIKSTRYLQESSWAKKNHSGPKSGIFAYGTSSRELVDLLSDLFSFDNLTSVQKSSKSISQINNIVRQESFSTPVNSNEKTLNSFTLDASTVDEHSSDASNYSADVSSFDNDYSFQDDRADASTDRDYGTKIQPNNCSFSSLDGSIELEGLFTAEELKFTVELLEKVLPRYCVDSEFAKRKLRLSHALIKKNPKPSERKLYARCSYSVVGDCYAFCAWNSYPLQKNLAKRIVRMSSA